MLHTTGNEVKDKDGNTITSKSINPEDCRLTVSLIDKSNSEYIDIQSVDNLSQSFELNLDTSTLELGEYALEARLVDKRTSKELDRNIHTIRRITDFSGFGSYIDEYGRLIKNGKTEFYTFVYIGNEAISELPANSFDGVFRYWNDANPTPYGDEFFAEAENSGYGVLANMGFFKDNYGFTENAISSDEGEIISNWINYLKGKDNLDFYYVGDEESPKLRDRIRWRSDIMSNLDMDVPTVYVDNINRAATIFANNQNADIMALDNYTIQNTGSNEYSWVGVWTRQLKDNFINKPIWMIHQCANRDEIYNLTDSEATSPTEQQMVNLAMQSIIGGATGIGWYSYNDIKETETNGREPEYSAASQLEKLCSANEKIEALSDIIMSVEQAPGLQFEVSSYKTDNGNKTDHIEYMVKQYNGKTYLFIVQNARYDTSYYNSGIHILNPKGGLTVSVTASGLTPAGFKLNEGECSYKQSGDVITVTMPTGSACVIELD